MTDVDDTNAKLARTNAAIRGAGLVAIVFAFLVVSKSFTSGDQAKSTTPRLLVYADIALKHVVPESGSKLQYRFGDPGELRRDIRNGATADVYLADTSNTEQLANTGHCTEPASFATNHGTATGGTASQITYASCFVNRDGADRGRDAAYAAQLTELANRQRLVEAGFGIPRR